MGGESEQGRVMAVYHLKGGVGKTAAAVNLAVARTERDLKRTFPQRLWSRLHLQIIIFGRTHCPARRHRPADCPICRVIGRRGLKPS